ncbi:phage tail protein [Nocardia sp. NPDC059246]|uniref:phage tail protein n=1 Tax=unclassified Nocardia TaxID=2637762 RepID=UPI0036CAD7AF
MGAGDRGVYLGTHPEGIYDEPVESIWNSQAFQIGADFGGIRVHKREVILGAEVINTSDQSWQRNDSDFRKAWSYKKDSKLWCETEEWGRRFLRLRLTKTPDFSPDTDPFKDQYGHVIYSGTAGWPRWQEDDVTDPWISTTDTTDGSWADGFVTVSNPTDTEMWLKWVLQAYPGAVYKLPDFSLGDDRFERASAHAARKITMPALIAGEHVRVDTDEHADQVVSDIDTQIYQRMRGVRFLYPIPPETKPMQLPVSVKNAPAGVGVQVRCPRNWSRPYGLD